MGTKSMQQRADQSRQLLNWGFSHFKTTTAVPKGQYVTKAEVFAGKDSEVEVVAGDNLNVLVQKTDVDKISTIVKLDETIAAPITKGQVVGKMTATIGGKNVGSVDVVANQDVAQANIISRTFHNIIHWIKNLF